MERNTTRWEALDPRIHASVEKIERAQAELRAFMEREEQRERTKKNLRDQLATIAAAYGMSYEHCLERHTPMEENPSEMEAMDAEMEPTAEARAAKKNRNVDFMERTLSLAARAEDLAGEVTYNSATEAGAKEKIDAFQAHMKAGVEMGKELLALFKA